mmetsp:Transcript_64512/g.210344  ORF Transcript_64512/g.210344 Transcript_64512/m.210344 type:complete len:220 (+) Transcript_64512:896-1555(+)
MGSNAGTETSKEMVSRLEPGSRCVAGRSRGERSVLLLSGEPPKRRDRGYAQRWARPVAFCASLEHSQALPCDPEFQGQHLQPLVVRVRGALGCGGCEQGHAQHNVALHCPSLRGDHIQLAGRAFILIGLDSCLFFLRCVLRLRLSAFGVDGVGDDWQPTSWWLNALLGKICTFEGCCVGHFVVVLVGVVYHRPRPGPCLLALPRLQRPIRRRPEGVALF